MTGRAWPRRAAALVAPALLAGGAETSVRVETRPPEPVGTIVGAPIDGSTRYGVLLRPEGADLAVEVRASELCPSAIELRVPRVRVEQRRGATASYAAGVLLAAVGAGVAVDALARERSPQAERDLLGRGVVLAVAGGTTVAVTHSRARTVVVGVEPLAERAAGPVLECRLRPAPFVLVSLRTAAGLRAARTGTDGRASFEGLAGEVPREVFVEDRPATFVIAP